MRPSRIGLSMASLLAVAAISGMPAIDRRSALAPKTKPRPRQLPKPGTLEREIADYNAEVDRRKAEKKQAKRLADHARQEQPAGEGEK